MSGSIEIILCWVFVGVLWILARHIGYREGFKDGYKLGEESFKPWKWVDDEGKRKGGG